MRHYYFYIVFVCSLALASCNSTKPIQKKNPPMSQIDATLDGHLKLFLEEALKRQIIIDQGKLDRLDIKFRDLPPNVLGTARETKHGRIEVVITSARKYGNSKWLTLHELGHGLLGMKHRDSPLSIMNPTNVDVQLDNANTVKVFDEFLMTTESH